MVIYLYIITFIIVAKALIINYNIKQTITKLIKY